MAIKKVRNNIEMEDLRKQSDYREQQKMAVEGQLKEVQGELVRVKEEHGKM